MTNQVESDTELTASYSNASGVIALTGATGFIGQTLLNQVTEAGWQVKALYRPKKGRTPVEMRGVEWLEGDLKDDEALSQLLEGCQVVIHCAGAVRGASREDFDRVNEQGARKIAEMAAKLAQTPRFLLISSLAAREPELSHYAGSKWRGECAIKSALDTMRWTIIRPPAVYGPGDKEMLPLFKGMAGGFLTVPAGSAGRFSLIYVDDLVAAIVSWLKSDKGYGSTFELDDGHSGGYDWDSMMEIGSKVLRDGKAVRRISIPIMLLKFVARMNISASKLIGYAPMLTPGKVREITHSDWVSDTGEFAAITGWKPKFGLERGLACIFGKNTSKFRDC